MNPVERRLWMNAKRAPAGTLLVYERELALITNQLLGAKMEAETSSAKAKRLHAALTRARNDVDSFLTLLQSLANHMDDTIGSEIIHTEANRVGETLRFLKEEVAK